MTTNLVVLPIAINTHPQQICTAGDSMPVKTLSRGELGKVEGGANIIEGTIYFKNITYGNICANLC